MGIMVRKIAIVTTNLYNYLPRWTFETQVGFILKEKLHRISSQCHF